jgi:hypothetical protein
MPENDLKLYKEKFLENFNSAVTKTLSNGAAWNPARRGRTILLLNGYSNGQKRTIYLSGAITFSGDPAVCPALGKGAEQ